MYRSNVATMHAATLAPIGSAHHATMCEMRSIELRLDERLTLSDAREWQRLFATLPPALQNYMAGE